MCVVACVFLTYFLMILASSESLSTTWEKGISVSEHTGGRAAQAQGCKDHMAMAFMKPRSKAPQLGGPRPAAPLPWTCLLWATRKPEAWGSVNRAFSTGSQLPGPVQSTEVRHVGQEGAPQSQHLQSKAVRMLSALWRWRAGLWTPQGHAHHGSGHPTTTYLSPS